MNLDKQYLDILQELVDKYDDTKTIRDDRTGVGTISLSGRSLRYNVDLNSFPILTTKKVIFKAVLHELLWILSGSTNIKYLTDNNVKIWNEWADEDGELGPLYGFQLRNFNGTYLPRMKTTDGVDQIANVIENIKNDPNSRRHVITTLNPNQFHLQRLFCCHGTSTMFIVRDGYLDMVTFQRSADVIIGIPFNLTSYALLLAMIAQVTGYKAGEIQYNLGDVHLYSNHIDQAHEQLLRHYDKYEYPQLIIDPSIDNIDDFKFEHFSLLNYESEPFIKAPIAV